MYQKHIREWSLSKLFSQNLSIIGIPCKYFLSFSSFHLSDIFPASRDHYSLFEFSYQLRHKSAEACKRVKWVDEAEEASFHSIFILLKMAGFGWNQRIDIKTLGKYFNAHYIAYCEILQYPKWHEHIANNNHSKSVSRLRVIKTTKMRILVQNSS